MIDPAGTPEDRSPLRVLWERRWLVLATTLVVAVTAAVVSKTLDPVYTTSAKLLVVQSSDRQSFDAVQAAQVTARTYADILRSSNLADEVARRLGGGVTRADLQRATSFEPIPETQLLRITAEQGTAAAAQRMANTYADVFEEYARARLRPTTEATVSIADRAPLPSDPARPKPTLYTMLAALLGFALGTALAFLRDRFDTRVEGADELEREFGLPLLARVPRRGSSRDSISRFAEAFRMLRVAVAFSDPEAAPRSVVVTSAAEGEGKTTTARQLTLAAAEAGQRVIVVEADVYHPGMRAALHAPVEAGARGLTSYLLGQGALTDVLTPTGAPGVELIAAGPAPLSLASLLETDRGRTFIDELEALCDLVVLDCPPIGPRADAAVLASRADATILVVDPAVSDRQAIRDALRALASVHAKLIGAVVNRVSSGAAYSAYYGETTNGAGTVPTTPRSPAA